MHGHSLSESVSGALYNQPLKQLHLGFQQEDGTASCGDKDFMINPLKHNVAPTSLQSRVRRRGAPEGEATLLRSAEDCCDEQGGMPTKCACDSMSGRRLPALPRPGSCAPATSSP